MILALIMGLLIGNGLPHLVLGAAGLSCLTPLGKGFNSSLEIYLKLF